MKKKINKSKILSSKGKKVAVGISGGIDSAAALLLLKQQGWQPIGIFLRLPIWKNKNCPFTSQQKPNQISLQRARSICKQLNVPFHIVDTQKEFKQEVVGYYLNELQHNRTPNPCVKCNPNLKFAQLFKWADKHKIYYVATGHYAKINQNTLTGEYQLVRAKDRKKDQSYYLAFLPSRWLPRIIFPLENYYRSEIEKLATKAKLKPVINIKSSQDFCFLNNCPITNFIKAKIKLKSGLIKDTKGHILGHHQGLPFYTIGQRKGLNLSGGPYYVKNIDSRHNLLVVTKNKKELFKKTILLSSIYFINKLTKKQRLDIRVKTRYRQPLVKATLHLLSRKRAKLTFIRSQRAISPGQFAVFYQDNVCLGGGKIEKALP